MKPVCVLGNGQLGRMLRQAGEPLGIAVYPVASMPNPRRCRIRTASLPPRLNAGRKPR